MFDVYIILIFCFFFILLVDSTSNKIVASSSLIEFVSLPPEVLRVSQNNKRVRFELNTTEKVVVSSLLSPAKEGTVFSLISNTERTTVIPIPTIELISLPMEVSGDSHSSYRGSMHALTTIFEEKRVLGRSVGSPSVVRKAKASFALGRPCILPQCS